MRTVLMTLAMTATLGALALLPGCSGRVGYSHYDRPAHYGYVYQERGPYFRPYSPYRYNRPVVVREHHRDGIHADIHVRD